MTKIILGIVVLIQFVVITHAIITVQKLNVKIHEYKEWFNNTELKIDEVKQTAQEMRNICEMYLRDDSLLMDNGNNQSQ